METKFTKGKWRVKHSESKDAWNVIGSQLGCRYKIARCPYLQARDLSDELNQREQNEQNANALLISKAPEMFEMLERILEFNIEDSPHIREEIKQLLKEATEL